MKNKRPTQRIWQKFFKTTSVVILALTIFLGSSSAFADLIPIPDTPETPVPEVVLTPQPTPQPATFCDSLTTEETCKDTEDNLNCSWIIDEKENGICQSGNQNIVLGNTDSITDEVTGQEKENWTKSHIQTFGLKFLVRGKEALGWSLNINNDGLDNPAIQNSYSKVLTIVNSLFILGLLAIAGMWMFSLLIPRHRLKKATLVFALAVMLINFALPANRLLIDGTNILQKTLLTNNDGKIEIIDIVSTPDYINAIGYQNKENIEIIENKNKLEIEIESEDEVVKIGEINSTSTEQQLITNSSGATTSIDVPVEKTENIALSKNQTINLTQQKTFNPNQEQEVFGLILMTLTGVAYFVLALLFLIRTIILWLLLILSPVLLILVIFKASRGYFYNWISIYGRWLLIGPLAALSLSAIIEIWKIGAPITSTYEATESFTQVSNIGFYLPGSSAANYLATTEQMMEYIIFLIMLYLPVAFAFMLTRSKTWNIASEAIKERVSINKGLTTKEISKTETRSENKEKTSSIKDILSNQIKNITQTAMPGKIGNIKTIDHPIPSSSSFLPESLATTSIHGMLELLGVNSQSRHSRNAVMEKLAAPHLIQDEKEKHNVQAVRNSIESRAQQGSAEAMVLMGEIKGKEKAVRSTTNTNSTNIAQSISQTKNVSQKTSNTTEREGVKNESHERVNVNVSTPTTNTTKIETHNTSTEVHQNTHVENSTYNNDNKNVETQNFASNNNENKNKNEDENVETQNIASNDEDENKDSRDDDSSRLENDENKENKNEDNTPTSETNNTNEK